MKRREFIPALAAAMYGMGQANAQSDHGDYPNRPVTLLVGFPAGGLTDILARRFVTFMQDTRKATVVVENRAGASGQIASAQLTKARPDGYTLMFAATHHVINPAINPKLPYDTKRDFTSIAELGAAPNVLLVNNEVPANNLKEFLEFANRSGRLPFGSTSIGGSTHLSGELFSMYTKAPLVHVPYKGAAPMLNDLLGGQVKCAFLDLAGATPFLADKRVKAIGLTSQERVASMPQIPTFVEQGLKDFVVTTFWGAYGPAGMPAPLVEHLNQLVVRFSNSPDMVAFFAKNGGWPSKKSAPEFNRFISSEIDRWVQVAKDRNITVD